MAVKIKVIRCAECGTEVDRVEYDPDAGSAQVKTVAEALSINEDDARKIVEKQTGHKAVTQADAADDLTKQITSKSVPGRKVGTYACPNGHKGDLTAEEQTR